MGSRFSPPKPGRPGRRGLAKAAAALAGAGLVAAVSVIVASAAVPTFPDNIMVFPDRDFISLEGFQDHAGEMATVEIRRGATLMGSATGQVSGGDVAFEVNHPGGVCWGNGTSLKVTPDIIPGDVAVIRFQDGTSQDVTVQDAQASDAVQDGLTVKVAGKVGPGVNRDFMEQRIINPDLIPLIGKRDVRAVPGPLTPAPKGGYSSSLEFPADAPGTFLATYVFTDPEAAAAAANAPLGERAMAWQEQDAAGNRQGMTIAEFGELGGPGFGGCPAGPADQSPPAGSAAFVRSLDKTLVRVNWTPVAAQPGAAPVTGYSVEALGATPSTTPPLNNQRSGLTRRTPADAQSTTFTGLSPNEDYTIEVRSLTGTRMGDAFQVQGTATNPGTVIAPTLTVSPAPIAGTVVHTSAVTLSSTPAGTQLFYTDDGTPVIDGDLPSDTAKPYAGPIQITKETTLSFMAIDGAGLNDLAGGTYAPPTVAAPAAPTGLTATAGQQQATLRWTASNTATSYSVQLYDGATPVGPTVPPTSNTTLTATGLTAGKTYTFTVTAHNATGDSPESSKSAPFTPSVITDQVTIGTARWKVGDFRVTGTDSLVGATVSLRTGSATGTVIGQAQVIGAAAPATGGTYDIRLRNGAAGTSNPGKVWVTSSGGGVAGPFTVANG